MPRIAWIALAAALPFLGLAFLSWPAMTDPGLFADDLKWFGGADNYRSNLEREGRWVAYWWNTRLGLAPPWLGFTLCWALWCAACALVADAMQRRWAMVVLAAALAASPGAISMLMWPTTSLPAMALLLLGTGLVRRWPGHAWPLLLALPLLCLTHQLLAMLLVGFALLIALAHGLRPWRVLAGGVAGLALGMLAPMLLNAWLLGSFGLAEDPWRYTALEGARGLTAAWRAAGITLREWTDATGSGFIPLALAGLALGLAALARRPVHLLMLAGIGGVTLALPFATGMMLPELRGTMLAWLALVGLLGFALAGRTAPAAGAALAALVAIALPPAAERLARFSADEAANRAVISEIVAAVAQATRANPPGTLVMVGLPERLRGLAGREGFFTWPLFQAEALTHTHFGRRLMVDYCPRGCPNGRVLTAMPEAVFPAPGHLLVQGDVAVVRIGP